MPSKAEPLVGLVWVADFDPTTAGGVAAPLWQFLIRTDTEQLYFKSGTANTAWTSLSGGGGGGSLTVSDGTTSVADVVEIDLDPASGFVVTDEGGGAVGVAINKSAFFSTARYTVTGSEPDLSSIVISLTSLGIAQPNTNYNAIVTGGGMAFGVSIDTVQADNTINSIHIVGGPWTADDVLVILIVPFVPV